MRKWVCMASLIFLLLSCTTTRYVEREHIVRDTLFRMVERYDSVRVTDSVSQNRWQEGDTVYMERVKIVREERIVALRDTVRESISDSVTEPVVVKDAQLSAESRNSGQNGFILILVMLTAVILILIVRKK